MEMLAAVKSYLKNTPREQLEKDFAFINSGHKTRKQSILKVYTDGSAKDGAAGWAFVINHNIFHCGIVAGSNAYRAELAAVANAIVFCNEQGFSHDRIIFYSDFNSMVNHLNSVDTDYIGTNKDLWHVILPSRYKYEFKRLPRNSNEQMILADDLAGAMARMKLSKK